MRLASPEYAASDTPSDPSTRDEGGSDLTTIDQKEVYVYCYKTQMELQSSTSQTPAVTETGTFVASNATTSTDFSIEGAGQELHTLRQDESRMLANYLSRPVRILTQVVIGGYVIYNPLEAFLTDALVRSKIRGYAYLHGTLHIKTTINAPARSSGALYVALHPWMARDNGLGLLHGYAVARLNPTQISCLPHILVDLSDEAAGEVSMPIVAPVNGLNITNLNQVKDAFSLHVFTLIPPQIDAGDSTAKPTLNIYAWMTDVKLSGPTDSIELQSDEYSIAPKNQPSTIKMALRNSLEYVLNGVKGFATDLAISSLYAAVGLSKPFNLEPVVQHVPRSIGPLANFNGMDSIPRLTGDIKQEVYIHSDHLGYSNGDEMDMMSIMKRPALTGNFLFSTDENPYTGSVYARISPAMSNLDTIGVSGDIGFAPSPMAMVSLAFSKWRGSIKVKLRVICSAFGRGKIQITHDPLAVNGMSSYVDRSKANRVNTVIWDISENKEIVLTIPWTSNLPFKPLPLLHTALTGSDAELFNIGYNGVLQFTPITSLIDPGMNTISILFSPYAGDDLVFGDPRPVLANYTFAGINRAAPLALLAEEQITDLPLDDDEGFAKPTVIELQSNIENVKLDGNIMTGDVQQATMAVNIAGFEVTPSDSDEMLACCIGEKYTNLRQIIKRYTHTATRRIATTTGEKYYSIVWPDKPFMKGWQGSSSINVDPTGVPCTYARDSYMNFFSTAFLGYRGGFNHKYTLRSSTNPNFAMQATRASPILTDGIVSLTSGTTPSAFASDILSFPDTRSGSVYCNTNENSVLEFNTPYYSTAKFLWSQDRTNYIPKDTLDRGYDAGWHSVVIYYNSGTAQSLRVDRFTAAADDFTFYMFLYPPIMLPFSPGRYT